MTLNLDFKVMGLLLLWNSSLRFGLASDSVIYSDIARVISLRIIVDAIDVLCAQLTRDLFAIATFFHIYFTSKFGRCMHGLFFEGGGGGKQMLEASEVAMQRMRAFALL